MFSTRQMIFLTVVLTITLHMVAEKLKTELLATFQKQFSHNLLGKHIKSSTDGGLYFSLDIIIMQQNPANG